MCMPVCFFMVAYTRVCKLVYINTGWLVLGLQRLQVKQCSDDQPWLLPFGGGPWDYSKVGICNMFTEHSQCLLHRLFSNRLANIQITWLWGIRIYLFLLAIVFSYVLLFHFSLCLYSLVVSEHLLLLTSVRLSVRCFPRNWIISFFWFSAWT